MSYRLVYPAYGIISSWGLEVAAALRGCASEVAKDEDNQKKNHLFHELTIWLTILQYYTIAYIFFKSSNGVLYGA
jgi:hypothetical protein